MASAHAWKRLTDAKYLLVVARRADTVLPLVMSEERSNESRRNRLPRRFILRGKDSFDVLFENGIRIAGEQIDIRYIAHEAPEKKVLTAFVVGKKMGNAVQRNRCKRLLREAYRLQQHILDPINDPKSFQIEMAIILKNSAITFNSVSAEIHLLLTKLSKRLSPPSANS
jgi:ribonuclease P protein component